MQDLYDVTKGIVGEALGNLHTATIAKITSVNGDTVNCQPVIARKVGEQTKPLPEMSSVPFLVMQGGGSHTLYPIKAGDYCLLIFTERSFDKWYEGADNQTPLEPRMFDYSDGIAIVGVFNRGGAKTIPEHTTHTGDYENDGDFLNQGTLDVMKLTTIHENLIVLQDVHIAQDLTVLGNMFVGGGLTMGAEGAPGKASFSGDVDMTGNMEIKGELNADNIKLGGKDLNSIFLEK